MSKRYGAVAALDGVTLIVPAGQFVALVGASGSGKTTLLKTVNRLIAPDAGRVLVDGADVAAGDAAALRRGIGYAFQGVGLFPHWPVVDNISAVLTLLRWDSTRIRARVSACLSLVELDRSLLNRLPGELSGGQRQRVGVARALAAEPKLLLLDEPFGALDPLTRDGLASRVRGLHDTLGLTTVLVTHDMAEALLLADRIVVLADGRVAADATPAALLAGHDDPAVAAMIATPKRQATRLAELAGG